ncbi:MAG: hypothetical protein K0S09_1076 [Sphingobacteriaceae bacterium]|jgi:hypothetical protein|nr:hypothetical protein [Sphingobacteriaceae bacterium]
MKKLFTVLALCASVLVASAKTDDPKAKTTAKTPAKKEATCKKGGDCCKKDCSKKTTSAAPKAKASVKKS